MRTLTLSGAGLLAAAALTPTAAGAQRYGDGYRAPRYAQAYRPGHDAPRGAEDGRGGYDARDGDADRGGGYRRQGYRDRRCDGGTGGALIGAIAGGLLGRTIDTRGDRALAGDAIGRSGSPGYCRR